jgi:enamine deaminase RidA (YjgF/YER057c/UK114 family)
MCKFPVRRRVVYAAALFALGAWAGLAVPRGKEGFATAQAGDPRPGPGAEARLRQLKLELPPPVKVTNTLVRSVRVGDLLFVSGHGPTRADGKPIVGRLGLPPKSNPAPGDPFPGTALDVKRGRAAARLVGLNILSTVRAELGSLDKVVRVVKTLGMVQATPDFTQHPQVVDGFSDLMVEVFGEKAGKGARSAVGMASLPGGIPVEVEVVFQVRQ